MTYGFPFFGARPDDWHTDAHPYRVVFASRPQWSELRQLAVVLEDFLARHPDITLGPWRWSGRHARFEAESTSEADLFFLDMQSLMRSLHRQARIAEAIHESSVGGGSSDWDEWTASRNAIPTRAPDDDWAIDGTFEALREERRPLSQEAVQRESERKAQEEALMQAARAGAVELSVAPVEQALPEPLEPPEALKALFEAAGAPIRYLHAAGRWVGLVERGMLYVDKNGKVKKRAIKTDFKGQGVMSPDGGRLIVSGFRSYVVSFPDAKVEESMVGTPAGFIGNDRVVGVDGIYKTVKLWTCAGRELDAVVCGASRGWALPSGAIVVACIVTQGERTSLPVRVYRVREDKLVLVAETTPLYPECVWEADGRVFAVERTGVKELVGIPT